MQHLSSRQVGHAWFLMPGLSDKGVMAENQAPAGCCNVFRSVAGMLWAMDGPSQVPVSSCVGLVSI
jgi:hypothetical protein